ncbi:MAG: hypothetical protein CVV15_06570 [Gammaproteobacteria bacterium HGW-Gammaproteobacteria-5]|nr:MAG: hypothetical protein CVV15_06570 [Gammaproteobacteria bacterium HGW-Gammaproteobacteria-5]
MIRRVFLVLLGLLLAAVLALAFAPAQLLVNAVQARVPDLYLSTVAGSLWRGAVGEIVYRGRALGSLRWRLYPSSLFSLRLRADIEAHGDWGNAEGQIWRSFSTVGLEALRSELPAYYLAGVFAVPEMRPLGSIRVEIHAAQLRDHMLVVLDGDAVWHDAAVAGLASADLGTLRGHLSLDAPNAANLVLADDGGPLAVDGQLWLSPLGYSGVVRMSARDPALLPALEWMGKPKTPGARELRLQGLWYGTQQ